MEHKDNTTLTPLVGASSIDPLLESDEIGSLRIYHGQVTYLTTHMEQPTLHQPLFPTPRGIQIRCCVIFLVVLLISVLGPFELSKLLFVAVVVALIGLVLLIVLDCMCFRMVGPIQMYQSRIRVTKWCCGSNSPIAAYHTYLLGWLYERLNQPDEALRMYQNMLEDFPQIQVHMGGSVVYKAIGRISFRLGYYQDALAAFQGALRLDTLRPANALMQLATYHNVGLVLRKLGRYQDAIDIYTEAIQMLETHGLAEYIDTAKTYANMGASYSAMSDKASAIRYFDKALDIFHDNLGTEPIDPRVARVYELKAELETQRDTILANLEQALLIYQRMGRIDSHPIVERVRQEMARLEDR